MNDVTCPTCGGMRDCCYTCDGLGVVDEVPVGIGSVLERVADGQQIVVTFIEPASCTTMGVWHARNGKTNTVMLDSCDYDPRGRHGQPPTWRVVRLVPPTSGS